MAPVMALLQSPPSEPPRVETAAQIGSYRQHVGTFARELERAVRAALVGVRDEVQLAQMAGGLLKAEMDRRAAFAPFLGAAEPSDQTSPERRKLGEQLREGMSAELAAMRDGRLRLEFRRAEIINQVQAATRVRVILRGGAQIRLYLNRRLPDGTPAG